MYKIGIDLGGTKIEGVVLGHDNKEIYRKRIPNGKEHGYEMILDNIQTLYKELETRINHQEHKLGLGTPGSISKTSGLLKNSNILFMNGLPFVSDLKTKLGHNIVVENDANCFALAEALIGAGKGHDLVFGVIMGTGCGGGLVYKGEVIRGLRENCGEWGHSTINFDNGPSWNGAVKGIVESYISGTGVQERHKERTGVSLAMDKIVEGYRNGDAESSITMNNFFLHFGVSMGNLIKFLDPDVIVLGGGLSNVDELYTEGMVHVKNNVLGKDLYTPIVKNQYGDSAGMFGAALIGAE